MREVSDIRNVAVIAHVDHGKTTLVDAMLKQTNTFRENQEEMGQERIMDSNDLEREKGITILSKNTSVFYKGVKINIIDTPGHADFGGEVERVMNMADGALLIVDAAEGPMPQTKFVLKKAFEAGLKVIVVINKIDRKDVRAKWALTEVENLFLSVAETEDSLDFPVVYALGREGKTFEEMPEDLSLKGDTAPLFECILKNIPNAVLKVDGPFMMMVSSFERNEYLGRLAMGRVKSGTVKRGDRVKLIGREGEDQGRFTIEKLYVNEGLEKAEANLVKSGEIVYLAGGGKIKIGQTVAEGSVKEALPAITVGEPTIRASFAANSSIFVASEARFLTSRELIERLREEVEIDLGLRLEENENDPAKVVVVGRGELHLAMLIEKIRREGYALEVGKPEVVLKKIEGVTCEPWEELTVLVTQDQVGVVSSEVGRRKGEMTDMGTDGQGNVRMIYEISEENALGLRTTLMSETRGRVSLSFLFLGFRPRKEVAKIKRNGVMVATETGKALAYGLSMAQKRGVTFIEPGEEVYEGQVVGLRPTEGDLEINVCKGKQLTNMRASGSDEAVVLSPAVKYSLEESLDFIESDELLDVTPREIRLRKRLLGKLERVRQARRVRAER